MVIDPVSSNPSSFVLELALVAITSVISIGVNFLNIRTNLAWSKRLKHDEAEEAERKEKEKARDRQLRRNTRMLDFLRWSGYFSRYADDEDNSSGGDWDA